MANCCTSSSANNPTHPENVLHASLFQGESNIHILNRQQETMVEEKKLKDSKVQNGKVGSAVNGNITNQQGKKEFDSMLLSCDVRVLE